MNNTTKWYEHPLYHWMEEKDFSPMGEVLNTSCTSGHLTSILENFKNITLENVEFYPSGTYCEPDKTTLDTISDFYLIRMKQRVAKTIPEHCAYIFR